MVQGGAALQRGSPLPQIDRSMLHAESTSTPGSEDEAGVGSVGAIFQSEDIQPGVALDDRSRGSVKLIRVRSHQVAFGASVP